MDELKAIGALNSEKTRLEMIQLLPWYKWPVRYWFGSSRIERRIKELESRCFRLADNYLLKNDAEYIALAKENLKIMESSDLYFKVTATTMAVMHSHSTSFKGNISENGYAYCYTHQGNFPLNPVAEYMFPKRLVGHVNHWGELQLKAVTSGFGLIHTLPKDYRGRITADGSVELNINKTESDFLSGGKLMIDKMMANIFGSDQHAKKQFALNRQKMQAAVDRLILQVSDASV